MPGIPDSRGITDNSRSHRHLTIERALADNRLRAGNKVALLLNGPAAFKQIFKAVADASDSINFQVEALGPGIRISGVIRMLRSKGRWLPTCKPYLSTRGSSRPENYYLRVTTFRLYPMPARRTSGL